ncbi:zf-DHHC-domain-containing protein [Stipitochalara longipes BDJ]|nr:zf-DHHC-domain-containing protein [Stipitochalara longipes BDJ]
MQSKVEVNKVTINLWTARIIPIILAGIVGYATYVVVALLCVNYLVIKHRDHAAAIPILVIYFVLFLLMAMSFFRLVYITVFEPPYVPLGPRALRERNQERVGSKASSDKTDIGCGEYDTSADTGRGPSGIVAGSDNDPDSPGLELFYTKDVFVCDMDGKPKWCTSCANWKPDRAHHSRDCGRCIRKMDHFCPWVGGAIGENNFKFFIQFTGYTALYCTHVLVVMAFYVARQKRTQDESLNSQFAAVLGLAAFFGLFTSGMTITSIDLAMDNYTQVEKIGAKSAVHVLAILKPSRSNMIRDRDGSGVQPYYKEITYPLDAGVPPNSDYYQPADMPRTKIYSHARQSEPIGNPVVPMSEDSSKQSGQSMQESEGLPSHDSSLEANGAPYPTEQTADRRPPFTKERLSQRDLQATRTFAILPMLEPGNNPWNLGSRLLNFRTVMGTGLLDWFLPIRRSPCCNNEDTQSEYALGFGVDLLKSSVGFIPPRETDAPSRRRRRKSTHPKKTIGHSTQTAAQTSDPNVISTQPNPSIPLQEFKDVSTPSLPT